jgi:RNA polymerase sigma factor (TIGR02999 family)
MAIESDAAEDITQLLIRWKDGDDKALERLTNLVYVQLRHMAAALLAKERIDHTLQPTALVHELYIQLSPGSGVEWKCRGHFFAISAKLMRRILVDHARKRCAGKRGGGNIRPLDHEAFDVPGPDVLRVDEALIRLGRDHPRQATVAELRFFGGLSVEETVEALNRSGDEVSIRTVERDWKFSRAWLQNELGPS